MALSVDVTLNNYGGLVLNGAYIRIAWLGVNLPRDKYIDAYIDSYASAGLRAEGKPYDIHKIVSIPKEIFANTKCNDNDLLTCAYNYLKTLPEYEGAVNN